ncbi:unnamed protein product [Coffea canephora]|uniref:DH200=94 genomic scaffold, scaffold_537 n=1 Tax=Coffea canephora TaxID=49390 RepID=A0A068VIM2_COFCA|nr:unnamed protein product [Coffea canephora]
MVLETLGSLLNHCSKTKAFHNGISLHAVAIKAGMLCIINSNHTINMYSKCGKLILAHQLFDEMPKRNLVSWSALISGYDQAGKHLMAIDLFKKMRTELWPNEFIFSSALSSCASLLEARLGQQIHAQAVRLGCSSISFVSNSLISMYMKCGECSDAMLVFSAGASWLSSVSYNAVIAGLVENKQPEKGFEMYKIMCQKGLIPDRFTFMGVLGVCSSPRDMWRGMQLHCQIIKNKLDSMATTGNILITMYAKFNLIEASEKVFRLLEEKDIISWNTMITAFSHCEEHVKALSVFQEMQTRVALPDEFSYATALAASAGLASMRLGKQIHAHLIRKRPDEDTGIGNALLNMYAKCGCIEYAYNVFNQMASRNLVTWNSIIAGLASHGLGERALDTFECMKDAGMTPDSVTFVGLLSACNHAGLVDVGRGFFNCMDTIYAIPPDIEHFSCLIDLLGRAGRLSEAEEYVQKYQFGHDPVVLGCLLSACRLHGDVVTGKRVASLLLGLQPITTSPYILLSNLYASDGMWTDVAEARTMLKGSGLKKEPGWSLIDVDGYLEKFTIGDFSHSRIEEMVNTLKTLKWTGDEDLL